MDPIERPEYSLPPSQMSVRLPRTKNKAPADIQISAEQLLREALANQIDDIRPPRVQINDEEELTDYLHRKTAEFENTVRKQKFLISAWLKYAAFEEGLQDFKRARSVFERAINVDYKNTSLWLKYAEMEMRHKFVNNARNVWERAINYLPRVDQLWYKYAYMEEMLGNYVGARKIFERWMEINPPQSAWIMYSKFEERMRETDKAREIIYRMIQAHPEVSSFIKVAKFEEKHKNRQGARKVLEKCIEELGPHANVEEFFVEFTDFEIKCHEYERAREIFKYAIEQIPKEKAPKLYQNYINFEKQYGSKGNIEIVVLNKRRALYEKSLSEQPMAYDIWFDYIKLEESQGDLKRIREIYERAIANVPNSNEKKYWRRYIYFWINYAVFEESSGEIENSRQVYENALKIVPHQYFSFSKLWTLYAFFEIRQLNLEKARKILGTGIGKHGSEKIFQAYIELEMQLGEIDRCRNLYSKWIEKQPSNCKAWIKFSEFEKTLEEHERCRKILEIAISQTNLDMPELAWKAYIDTEIELDNYKGAKDLYERLLLKTKHLKVWVSYAQFEISYQNFENARNVLKRGDFHFKQISDKESRLLLLEAWQEIEQEHGDEKSVEEVMKKMPQKVKKKRKVERENEEEAGYEEYLDYIFPDETTEARNLKILEMAKKWKEAQESADV